MGRKVFISVIGPTPYRKSIYERNGLHMEETRYVQIATLEYLHAENWDNAVSIIGLTEKTEGSQNWDFEGTHNEEPYWGLKQEMERHFGNITLDPCGIPDGKDEEEIMEIFSRLYKRLQNGDELYFEMTNGLRYLPMLVLVLSNYTRFLLRDIEIKSMTYGNIQIRNEDGSCPIVDLMPLVALQNWTFAAGQYKDSGNVQKLIELGKTKTSSVLKSPTGIHHTEAKEVSTFLKRLESFIGELVTCRGLSIESARSFIELRKTMDSKNDTFIKALNPIFNDIKENLSIFIPQNDINNCFFASQWCLDKGFYQQAATFLEEYLISLFCKRNTLDYSIESNRDSINRIVTYKHECLIKEKFERKNKEYNVRDFLTEEEKQVLNQELLFQDSDFVYKYYELIEHRNDYNHSGMRWKKNPKSHKNMKEDIALYLKFFSEKLVTNKDFPVAKGNTLFLNYSNHPMEKWSKEQLDACSSFNMKLERKFPVVEDAGDEYYIQELVEEELVQIKELLGKVNPSDVTIHIMGEMTFTYAMVNALKAEGYKCVASTTKRNTIELEDGTKQSTFAFNKFREYR